MIDEILTASGINYRRARFLSPPAGTYAVYMDDVTTDGPDDLNWIRVHAVTIELYEATPDDTAEAALEAAMDQAGVRWTKQDRYWLQDEQRYQVVYEFEFYEKGGPNNGQA